MSFESVYVWSFIQKSSGNVFCAHFPLLFNDQKCFHIFLVSFWDAIDSEKCAFLETRIRCTVLLRYYLNFDHFNVSLKWSCNFRTLRISSVNHSGINALIVPACLSKWFWIIENNFVKLSSTWLWDSSYDSKPELRSPKKDDSFLVFKTSVSGWYVFSLAIFYLPFLRSIWGNGHL